MKYANFIGVDMGEYFEIHDIGNLDEIPDGTKVLHFHLVRSESEEFQKKADELFDQKTGKIHLPKNLTQFFSETRAYEISSENGEKYLCRRKGRLKVIRREKHS